jgi:membrane-associated phospholipid phosphatase
MAGIRRAVAARLSAADRTGVARVRALPHRPGPDASLVVLSRVTDHSAGWIALGLAGAVIDQGRRPRWLSATARIAAAEALVRLIKRAIRRSRPAVPGLPALAPAPSPLSFPSSHTAAAVAAIGAFDGLLPRGLTATLALLTAFSRLYLGLHYPSDVLAGCLIGRVCGSGAQ